ncbi:SEL1-like repeat protein [Peteryoungia desertarenae]|uniref:SEL1-like repeat protein n=1 Tax=Peteryoungia desertarenae TaxID=1813451 RepID=A0ABX6QNJ8_9HYPH|nr:sel1 repeat family protein [Peteryoungia desertarenae]QLF69871.1 SEL1-like repeat protein [Peteryoungia desertarenae]
MQKVQIGVCGFVVALLLAGPTLGQDVNQTVINCDRYAASNNDLATTAGRAGVRFKDLDTEKAKTACEAAYAANPDIARLAFQLARVEVKLGNYERARTLLEEALAKGYTLAAVELGLLYDTGRGVEADLKKALELYQLAADAGWGVAYSNIGDLYRLGLGVEKDEARALELYNQAIAKGNEAALGRKALMLAGAHQEGDDPRPVVSALLEAAIRGEAVGSAELGLAYLNGRFGLPVDPVAASVHLKRGFDAGDNFGGLYFAIIEMARWDGHFERAEQLRRALQSIVDSEDHENRGPALALLGQFGLITGLNRSQVTDLIERAAQLSPDHHIVLNSRANLLVANGDLAGADALLEKAALAQPDWAPYYARRSIIQLRLGNAEKSKELETQANNARDGQYLLQFIGG